MGETVLSTKGQIASKDVRDKLGLEAGQRFTIQTMSDGAILVIPIPHDVVAAMELPEAGERPGKHRRV